MKKTLIKILLIICILLCAYHNYSYADMVLEPIDTVDIDFHIEVEVLMLLLGIIILISIIVTHYSINSAEKKSANQVDVKGVNNLESKKRIRILCVILSAILIVGSTCSIILKINVADYNKKLLVFLQIRKNYDDQDERYYDPDIEGLIDAINGNSIFGKKTYIAFEKETYKSPEELEEFSKIIDREVKKGNKIYWNDIDTKFGKLGFIECITIGSSSYNEISGRLFNMRINSFEGMQTEYYVKELLKKIEEFAKTSPDNPGFIPEIDGNGEGIDGIQAIYKEYNDVSLQEYLNSIDEISKKLESKHTYTVEFNKDKNDRFVEKITIKY